MEGSFYALNDLFIGNKDQLSVPYDTPLAPTNTVQPLNGLYQVEESVDFSALVEACEKNISPLSTSTLSSSGFFEPDNFEQNFENYIPDFNMYSSEMNATAGPPYHVSNSSSLPLPLEHSTNRLSSLSIESNTLPLTFNSPATPLLSNIPVSTSPQLTASPNPLSITSQLTSGATPLVASPPAMGKSVRGSKSSKKAFDKDSEEYRDKRERNNVAVRKSRNKSKQRVLETEKRVKELEDENTQLQNKITVLSKELNVLKSLFASAGVVHTSLKSEEQASCQNSS